MQFNILMEYVQALPSLPDCGFLPLDYRTTSSVVKWRNLCQMRSNLSRQLLLVLCFGLVFVELDIAISSERALFDMFSLFPHDVFDCDAFV